MTQEHEIIQRIAAAQKDISCADRLVRDYLPFIKAQTAKFIHRIPLEGIDDELGIAMLAFHEAVMSYQKTRGPFLHFAQRAIKNRLIDFYRKERRHRQALSLDLPNGTSEEDAPLSQSLSCEKDEVELLELRSSARAEIGEFSSQLAQFGLKLTDIAENCPKQKRTLAACQRVLGYAREHPQLLDALLHTKKLPVTQLSAGSGVEKKTLERHRKYLVAILLAYTNGFEIIRGHLKHISPDREVHTV